MENKKTGVVRSRSLGIALLLAGMTIGGTGALAQQALTPGTQAAVPVLNGEITTNNAANGSTLIASMINVPFAQQSQTVGINTIPATGFSFTELVYQQSNLDLDFYFEYTLGTTTNLDFAENASMSNFLGVGVSVYYDGTSTVDGILAGTDPNSAPNTALQAGPNITFGYNTVGPATDNTGLNSKTGWFAIDTNATTLGLGSTGIHDSFTTQNFDYSPFTGSNPTPEAANVLFGLAITSVICVGLLRKKSGMVSESVSSGFAV